MFGRPGTEVRGESLAVNTVEAARALLSQSRRIGDRLYFYSLVRFLVVLAIATGALFAYHVVGVTELSVSRLLLLGAALGGYNLVIFFLVRPYRNHERARAAYAFLVGMMHATIMLDFLFLTMALWLVGGAKSPFLAFYLFHVILASMFLQRRAAFAQTCFGYILLAGLVLGEWSGWIPGNYPAGAVSGTEALDVRYVVTILVVYGMLFTLSALSITSLMALLQTTERGLRAANASLETLSALRRDFLHIVLHDLKSPVAAISQHVLNIEAALEAVLNEEQRGWIDRCKKRLKEQMSFLHDLETLALLESGALMKDAKAVDTASLVRDVVTEYQDLAGMRGQQLVPEFPEGTASLMGVYRLAREALNNLVSNAIKYTPEGGRIVVRAARRGERVRIEVCDSGLGIAPEDCARLFQEFVRLRPNTNPGEQRAPGSGLGLSIVRRIVEAHGGVAGVNSEVGKGSVFFMEFPAAPALDRL